MSWLRLASGSPLLLGLFMFLLVHPAVGMGIQAAENSSVDGAAWRANVTTAVETAKDNVSAELEGSRRDVSLAMAEPYLELTDAVLGSAFDFGYTHPVAATWYRRLSPVTVVLSLLGYAVGTYRDIRRG
jgi:hypothetical protein